MPLLLVIALEKAYDKGKLGTGARAASLAARIKSKEPGKSKAQIGGILGKVARAKYGTDRPGRKAHPSGPINKKGRKNIVKRNATTRGRKGTLD